MTHDDLTALLEAFPQPSLLIDDISHIRAQNRAAEQLIGSVGVSGHYMNALREPNVLQAIDEARRMRVPREAEMIVSGTARDEVLQVTVAPVDFSGRPMLLLTFVDVTTLRAAGQMRRDFVANVSHELKTPLTALLGFIDTLRGPAQEDTAARGRFLDIMAREAQRMNRLIGDLLSLSRVEVDERVRPSKDQDMAALVERVVATLSPLASDAGVVIETILEDRPHVWGDSDQLMQVLGNLIENAMKYGAAGGKVVVTLSRLENVPALRSAGMRLSVEDFGPGIAPQHLPRLTERFYRVDAHRSRDKGGTGLGLAIVKHIVNRHRGRFRIESHVGRGTVTTVLLPLAEGRTGASN